MRGRVLSGYGYVTRHDNPFTYWVLLIFFVAGGVYIPIITVLFAVT